MRLFLTAFLILFSLQAHAIPVQTITIKGNQRVDSESVKTYMTLKEGDEFDSAKLNDSIKALFKTGLFSDVSISPYEDGLLVEVVENPIVSQVAFEGNKAIDDEKLAPEVTLKARSLYTKAAVQENVQRIAEIYRKSGRYDAKVEPKVILKDQNRVDLVFEIDEGTTTSIKDIVFIGNKKFADSDLREVVKSAEYAWWNVLSSDDTYDADRIEYDKELLRRHYTNNGYADFKVTSAIAELLPDRSGFVVTYSLDEGKKYKFNKVQVVTQLQELKNTNIETDEEQIETISGKDYNASKVEKTVDNLVQKAGEYGFAFVNVDPQINRDREKREIDVTYVVKEGPKVYVDRININGNVRTIDDVIRRELKLSEGDPFNTSYLKRSKQRIENLDYFKKVDVSQEKGDAADKVNIDINVEEKSTGEINFGAGYSTTDGVLGDISVRERNLLGRGQAVTVSTTASARRQQGQFSFTEPKFMDKDFAAGFDIFKLRRDQEYESSYRSESLGFNLRGGYEISEHLKHNIKYSLSNDEVKDVDANASTFIKRQEGERLTSMIGHDFVYDMLDSRNNPKDGYLLTLSQDFAGIGGDVSFIRHEFKGNYYVPLTDEKDWTILFAGSAGNMFGLNDEIPINQRFFVGGRNFRGFDRGGVGPRDTATSDSLGGLNYYIGTAELSFPLNTSEEFGFTGALFTDIGSLWDPDENGAGIFDSNTPRMTVGAGVGWNSPFGPIRVDLGFPLLKEEEDETKAFQFNFGTRF